MKKQYLILFLMLAFAACVNQVDQSIEKLYGELIENHDVVMPKTMKIDKLKKQVLEHSDGEDALKIAASLQSASDKMYTWMDDFGSAMNDIEDKSQKLEAYERLNKDILQIDIETDNSIKAAKEFIQ